MNTPLVSIGVPIFNEERYIDETLTSLRGQQYSNIEIIISDNASTDATLHICERHAQEDSRIRIEKTATNRGATANFQHVLDLAAGTYFMWASGHDLWSENLVGEAVELLEAEPAACIAFASSKWIDSVGQPLPRSSGWADTRGLSPIARFFTTLWGNMHPVLGVMRLTELRACGPMPAIVGGDLVLLSALSLKGYFVHAYRAMWSRREFRHETQFAEKIKRYSSDQTGLVKSRFNRMAPLLALPAALLKVIWRSNLRTGDKFLILITLLPSMALRYIDGRRPQVRPHV